MRTTLICVVLSKVAISVVKLNAVHVDTPSEHQNWEILKQMCTSESAFTADFHELNHPFCLNSAQEFLFLHSLTLDHNELAKIFQGLTLRNLLKVKVINLWTRFTFPNTTQDLRASNFCPSIESF